MAKREADYTESDTGVFNRGTNALPSPPKSDAVANNNREPLPVSAIPEKKRKELVKFDPESEYYDMSGEKIMLIFSHIDFDKNFFDRGDPPHSRELGGSQDAVSMNKLFSSLGFKVIPYEDKKYADIKKIVTDLCRADHSATSCVAVAIMTHGSTNGVLYAYDTTYFLSDITEIFEKGHDTLVHKPKLFFIQALEVESSQVQHKTSEKLKKKVLSDEACRGDWVDPGKITYYDGQKKKSKHVSTHIDYLFARSTVEDYRAWRKGSGSWFLQELCEVIKTHHNNKDLLQMLTLVTRRVSYEHKSYVTGSSYLSDKKATPETKFTLTKLLKF